MRKIVGPSACPGEGAHDIISIVILEHEWSLSFKAEILVTAVTNWTLRTTRVENRTLPIIWEFLWKCSDTNHFLCILLWNTIPIWNEETRGSDWKIKSKNK